MKKDLQILYLILLSMAGFLFLLSVIPKQKIFSGSIFIQTHLNEENETESEVFLLSQEKLNINLIKNVVLETNQGFIEVPPKLLAYTDTFIKMNVENIASLKYPVNNVLIYANKISVLSFLFSNLI